MGKTALIEASSAVIVADVTCRHLQHPQRPFANCICLGYDSGASPTCRKRRANRSRRRVFDILSQSLVEVRLVADVPDLAGLSLTTTNLDGLPVIGLRESPHFGLNIVVKRVMDAVLSLIGIIILSPLLALMRALAAL